MSDPFDAVCATRKQCPACRDPQRSAKLHARREAQGNPVVCPLALPMGAGAEQIAAAIEAERKAKIVQVQVKRVPRPTAGLPATVPVPREKWPWPLRILARLAIPGEKGLGDTVHRQLTIGGADVIGWTLAALRIPCGCSDRQKWLNERFPY
jgi:hypothetical protein